MESLVHEYLEGFSLYIKQALHDQLIPDKHNKKVSNLVYHNHIPGKCTNDCPARHIVGINS